MRAFKVSLNGTNLFVAGVGDTGVLSAIVNWVANDQAEDLFLQVGGLANQQNIDWTGVKRLRVGDEIRVRIVEASSVDKPIRRRKVDPVQQKKDEKRYVHMIAKKLGWKIQTKASS